MRSIVSRMFHRRATVVRPGLSRTFRPQVEPLETRWCPAVTASFSNGVVSINGDNSANVMKIRDDGKGNVTLEQNGVTTHTFATVDRIEVFTKGGKDVVEYEQSLDRSRNLTLFVDLGSDADRFVGNAASRILAANSLEMKVNAGSGNDFLQANCGGAVEVGAQLRLDLNGGNDRDRITALYNDGKVDGILFLNARGGNGDDNQFRDAIEAVVNVAPGSLGQIGQTDARATVEGNDGNDELSFVLRAPGSPNFRVFATIDGGKNGFLFGLFGGKDVGRHTGNVTSRGIEKDIVVM